MNQRTKNDAMFNAVSEMRRDVYEVLSFGTQQPPLSPALFHDTVYTAFTSHWEAIPPAEPIALRPSVSTGAQFPLPGSHHLVPIPDEPFPARCSAATLSTGHRCRLPAYYSFTLCAVHFRFFERHAHLPSGGAQRPYIPHPDDVWLGPRGSRA